MLYYQFVIVDCIRTMHDEEDIEKTKKNTIEHLLLINVMDMPYAWCWWCVDNSINLILWALQANKPKIGQDFIQYFGDQFIVVETISRFHQTSGKKANHSKYSSCCHWFLAYLDLPTRIHNLFLMRPSRWNGIRSCFDNVGKLIMSTVIK